MTNPKIRVHNSETNEVIDREMTDAEFAELNAINDGLEIERAEAKAKSIAKAAILDRIGLTADELQTILG